MIGFFISAIIVTVLVVLVWLGLRIVDGDGLAIVGACFIVFIIFGLMINSIIESEAEDTCHKYETWMMYNAATKTVIPSRVCILWEEWVDIER